MNAGNEIPDVHSLNRIAPPQTKASALNTSAYFPHNEPLDIHL